MSRTDRPMRVGVMSFVTDESNPTTLRRLDRAPRVRSPGSGQASGGDEGAGYDHGGAHDGEQARAPLVAELGDDPLLERLHIGA